MKTEVIITGTSSNSNNVPLKYTLSCPHFIEGFIINKKVKRSSIYNTVVKVSVHSQSFVSLATAIMPIGLGTSFLSHTTSSPVYLLARITA